jgi:DNA-binding transcriptional regulator YdaS (Cro superfamily)
MAVYFARASDSVKIGWAVNVTKRLSGVQIGCVEPLTLARVVEGPRGLEGAFHRHYAHQHIRGEWFRWSDDMLTAVIEIEPIKRTALHRAVEMLGGQTATARLVGRKQSSVSMWLHRNKIPFEFCILVERATGGRITCEELRPDLADMLAGYRTLPGAALPSGPQAAQQATS